MEQVFKLDSQGRFTEKPNTGGTDKDSKKKSAKNSLKKLHQIWLYMCLFKRKEHS